VPGGRRRDARWGSARPCLLLARGPCPALEMLGGGGASSAHPPRRPACARAPRDTDRLTDPPPALPLRSAVARPIGCDASRPCVDSPLPPRSFNPLPPSPQAGASAGSRAWPPTAACTSDVPTLPPTAVRPRAPTRCCASVPPTAAA